MTTLDLRPVAAASLARAERAGLLAAAAAVAGVAWAGMLSSGPAHHGPASLTPAIWMWFVMMVAMMLPPVMPWLLALGPASGARETVLRRYRSVLLFAAGYFAVWLAYSVAAALIQLGLRRAGLLSHNLGLATLPGGLLAIAAGAYQLSPWKQACLRHCRSPLAWFLRRWKNGPAGAMAMGWSHGLVCLGCCWALMAVAFAAGVMNLLWMAGLTLLLCVEKIAPGGRLVSLAAGVALLGWGGWSIAAALL